MSRPARNGSEAIIQRSAESISRRAAAGPRGASSRRTVAFLCDRLSASAPLRGIAIFIVALAVSHLLFGCAIRTPAHPDRVVSDFAPTRLTADDWPPRDEPSELFAEGEEPPPMLTLAGAYGRGLMYELVLEPQPDSEAVSRPILRSFLFASTLPLHAAYDDRGPQIEYWVKLPHERVEGAFAPSERHNVTLMIHQPAVAHPSRGLVVHLTSVIGLSRAENRLLHLLRERGWSLLTVSHSSARRLDFVLETEGERDASVAAIAARIDHHLAERAYAVEAALALLAERQADLPQRPLVLIGSSAGALALPAVAASLDHDINAAVFIGGGADVFNIVRRSPVTRKRLEIHALMPIAQRDESDADESEEVKTHADSGRSPEPFASSHHSAAHTMHPATRVQLDEIAPRILDASRLDPHRLAPLLRDVPVLQLHARFDTIAPASSGDLLYERLGHPERWVYPTGHLGLFAMFGFDARRLADWIESAATQPSASSEGSPAATESSAARN